MVNRALSFATSDPKGPVYLCGAREVMEEDLKAYSLNQDHWRPIEPAALSPNAVKNIAEILVNAKDPLIITGYSGRNHSVPAEFVKLADTIKGLRVLDTGGCDMCFPADHPAWLGFLYGGTKHVEEADVILVIDCDVPWIPTQRKPRADATIIHIDVDPLKQQMPVFYINAQHRYRADSYLALQQINDYLSNTSALTQQLATPAVEERWSKIKELHTQKLQALEAAAAPNENGNLSTAYLMSQLKKAVPEDTIWVIEAVTNTPVVTEQLQCTIPGSYLNCGGGGLGWSGGAVSSLHPPYLFP